MILVTDKVQKLNSSMFRSLIDGIHLMVHFKALQILPLGDVTMIGAVRVGTNITSVLLVFFRPFHSLLLKIISNFQITNSIQML